MINHYYIYVQVAALLMVVLPVHAQSELSGIDAAPGQTDPSAAFDVDDPYFEGGLSVGPGRIAPGVKLKVLHTDNLVRQNSNTIDAFGVIVSPRLAYILADSTKNLTFDYILENGTFEGSSADNYLDHTIRGGFTYQPTRRIYSAISLIYKDTHDARGTGRAESGTGVLQDSLDEWHQWGVNGRFAYGSTDAIGRLELEADYFEKRYDTNREFTANRDRDALAGQARFNYRLQPKTFLTIEGRLIDNTYPNLVAGVPSLDSLDSTYLLGVRWEATFKTTGFARIGYNFKNFDSGQRDDTDGLTWEVGFDWNPKTYSTVHFETAQSFQETNGTGDAIDQTFYLLTWKHFWKPRFSTLMEAGYQNQTFDPTSREDDFFEAGVSANYDFRRWISLGLGYRYSNLDSNVNLFDYQENRFELTVEVAF